MHGCLRVLCAGLCVCVSRETTLGKSNIVAEDSSECSHSSWHTHTHRCGLQSSTGSAHCCGQWAFVGHCIVGIVRNQGHKEHARWEAKIVWEWVTAQMWGGRNKELTVKTRKNVFRINVVVRFAVQCSRLCFPGNLWHDAMDLSPDFGLRHSFAYLSANNRMLLKYKSRRIKNDPQIDKCKNQIHGGAYPDDSVPRQLKQRWEEDTEQKDRR